MSNAVATHKYRDSHRFGHFELQAEERRLLMNGQPVALGARAFDLLVLLVERAGQLVAKNELITLVWPGLVVEENNLQVQISTLRKVLGQSALATIPGRGYRFDLLVERADAAAPETAIDSVPPISARAPEPVRARTNLPAHLLTLYGRAQDLIMIKALVHQHTVVTVIGAGGIGKTRVAQAVAADVAVESASRFPDGVWWIELAALSDGAFVPSEVARALGVQLAGERPPDEAIASLLAAQQVLLVLDNCEHLTDAVAKLIETVRAAAPQVRFLVTSQETLKAAEEHIYRLGALAVPADYGMTGALQAGAIELFVARAQGVDPHFALTPALVSAVIEICHRLDGIPLAIELAAARLPLLGVEGLRTRLDQRFNVLTGGARIALRRHQTLRATLEWSHGLLTQDEQTVFRRLGVFAGSFTLEAAQHVAGDDHIDGWAALDHLGALVDKSLVLAEGDPVPRYRLLETTRAYTLERLAEAGETEHLLRRHAEAMLTLLATYDADDRRWQFTPADTVALAAELGNLRGALTWVVTTATGTDLVVPLAGMSFVIWSAASHLAEGFQRCLALRANVHDGITERDAARYWLTVAQVGAYGMRRESYDAALRAASLYRALGDDSRRYDALLSVAVQGVRFASPKEMEQAITAATALERATWPARQRAKLQMARFRWLFRVGRTEEALACAQRQVALNREGGDPAAGLSAMANVTGAEIQLGRLEAALQHARAAITELDMLNQDASGGHLYLNVMIALIHLGRTDEAISAGRSAHRVLLQDGDEHRLLVPLAMIAALQGRLADAARVIGFDDAVHASSGSAVTRLIAQLRALVDPLLAAALPAPELAGLLAEGAAMRDDQVFKLGFGDEA